MNVSFSFPLMCSSKGLLPQSSPSHLIHKEMTGITIPQQKMLWGSQCITSFFTFAPSRQQLYAGLKSFGGRGPPDSLRGKRTLSRRLPRAPLAARTCEAPPRGREGGCAAARVRPVALSAASSFHYIIFSSEGGWGREAEGERRRLQLFFALSLPPPAPISLEKTVGL